MELRWWRQLQPQVYRSVAEQQNIIFLSMESKALLESINVIVKGSWESWKRSSHRPYYRHDRSLSPSVNKKKKKKNG